MLSVFLFPLSFGIYCHFTTHCFHGFWHPTQETLMWLAWCGVGASCWSEGHVWIGRGHMGVGDAPSLDSTPGYHMLLLVWVSMDQHQYDGTFITHGNTYTLAHTKFCTYINFLHLTLVLLLPLGIITLTYLYKLIP